MTVERHEFDVVGDSEAMHIVAYERVDGYETSEYDVGAAVRPRAGDGKNGVHGRRVE